MDVVVAADVADVVLAVLVAKQKLLKIESHGFGRGFSLLTLISRLRTAGPALEVLDGGRRKEHALYQAPGSAVLRL